MRWGRRVERMRGEGVDGGDRVKVVGAELRSRRLGTRTHHDTNH